MGETYEAAGVSLSLDFTSLMTPYDIHDPAMDPMATADPTLAIANSGFGSAYASHFDMSVRARGERGSSARRSWSQSACKRWF